MRERAKIIATLKEFPLFNCLHGQGTVMYVGVRNYLTYLVACPGVPNWDSPLRPAQRPTPRRLQVAPQTVQRLFRQAQRPTPRCLQIAPKLPKDYSRNPSNYLPIADYEPEGKGIRGLATIRGD